MPLWTPEPVWQDQDVFVIGGGPSLRGFEWSLLHAENTVGCNTAFALGEQVCKVCVFGDFAWWQEFKLQLPQYKGTVFTNVPNLYDSKIPWLWFMRRAPRGLHTDALGWNGNTGAVAINLALLLGARRIYLLGYDMKRLGKNPNWHDKVLRPAANKPHVYEAFAQEFLYVRRDWKNKFADREIVNVTKDSGLSPSVFPWVDPDAFWTERKAA